MRYTKKKKHCIWCSSSRGIYKDGNNKPQTRKITLWGICNVCLFSVDRRIKKKYLAVKKGKRRLKPLKSANLLLFIKRMAK